MNEKRKTALRYYQAHPENKHDTWIPDYEATVESAGGMQVYISGWYLPDFYAILKDALPDVRYGNRSFPSLISEWPEFFRPYLERRRLGEGRFIAMLEFCAAATDWIRDYEAAYANDDH